MKHSWLLRPSIDHRNEPREGGTVSAKRDTRVTLSPSSLREAA